MKFKTLKIALYAFIPLTILTLAQPIMASNCGSALQCTSSTIVFATDFAPKETPISNLMTSRGDLYLFRVIDRKYEKGFVGGFAKEEGGISYSLNPYIAKIWKLPALTNTDSQVLISFHNIYSEILTYPTKDDYIGSQLKTRLTPRTRLKDIKYLDQVNTPIGKEQIIAILPIKEFEGLAETFSKENQQGFFIEDLVNYLLLSPQVQRLTQ